MSDTITTQRDGTIVEVALNSKANAVRIKTLRLMGETLKAFGGGNPDLRVAIKAAVDKFFYSRWTSRRRRAARQPTPTIAPRALREVKLECMIFEFELWAGWLSDICRLEWRA
ncbi:hypothetical protein N2603_38665 [Bradyrhizobium huanghuaihaiense]|uniref:hypothetical protein n=1 Tax=Bradyrhizobium huanghuaihaiense TaxID=990078 RepID=UPI0021AA9D53|nr:hypothetical protein [Bradyrhizobium sp. CB3035]UWU75825.1 hypothetical protein N2603_38665 [Bradyrhizobium sp. CB3035]